jgi:hypothetical protein
MGKIQVDCKFMRLVVQCAVRIIYMMWRVNMWLIMNDLFYTCFKTCTSEFRYSYLLIWRNYENKTRTLPKVNCNQMRNVIYGVTVNMQIYFRKLKICKLLWNVLCFCADHSPVYGFAEPDNRFKPIRTQNTVIRFTAKSNIWSTLKNTGHPIYTRVII